MADFNEMIIEEFRSNGGTVTTAGFGRSLVLLHHVGARSGEERDHRTTTSTVATLRPSQKRGQLFRVVERLPWPRALHAPSLPGRRVRLDQTKVDRVVE